MTAAKGMLIGMACLLAAACTQSGNSPTEEASPAKAASAIVSDTAPAATTTGRTLDKAEDVPSGSVKISGTVDTPAGTRPARLLLACSRATEPNTTGALSIELRLDTAGIAGFGFDEYEGPGAPASQQPSARLALGTLVGGPFLVAGWYSQDKQFNFGISVIARTPGPLTDFAPGLATTDASLVWTQPGATPTQPALTAHFRLDASQRTVWATAIVPCLPSSG
jgi:hypothetical protein